MFFDDSDGEQIGFSFAQIERMEAEKSSSALRGIDHKLYQCSIQHSLSSGTENHPEDHESIPARHYYSEGYEANYNGVDDTEISRWQKQFHYLNVTNSVAVCHEERVVSSPEEPDFPLKDFVSSQQHDSNYLEDGSVLEIDSVLAQVLVVGKAISPYLAAANVNRPYECLDRENASESQTHPVDPVETTIIAAEEEIFCSDGVLEECIECNYEDGLEQLTKLERLSDDCASGSKREEVINSLMEALWPDVVHAGLRPLVRKVLDTASANCVPIDIQQQVLQQKEQEEQLRPQESIDLLDERAPASWGQWEGTSDSGCHTGVPGSFHSNSGW